MIIALIIFIITYLFIGLRQAPRLQIDRPAGALVGAVLMIVLGVLTLDQAFSAIDMHTLLLLLGMMIITVYLRTAGFFELMADKMLSLSKTPLQLLILVVISSGLLSALFVNDTEAVAMERSGKQLTATIVPLDTHTASRAFDIVLLCDTEETRARGLQGFRRLRTKEAALFQFETPEAATFWMGSVAYPIDIVFISSDKKVVRVYPDCKPGSRDLYYSHERAAWVIETAAGSGIRVGDRVRIEGTGISGPEKKP